MDCCIWGGCQAYDPKAITRLSRETLVPFFAVLRQGSGLLLGTGLLPVLDNGRFPSAKERWVVVGQGGCHLEIRYR
jgi:hypothetical protein